MYLLGLDIGSSSIKVSIVRAVDGIVMSIVQHPSIEMEIISLAPGYAEQHPEKWWEYAEIAIKKAIQDSSINGKDIVSIGISYQMHGLVLIDKNKEVLRPSIIWCDSRAVEIGKQAFEHLGKKYCLENYLNSPGNFTASKLKWVKENEPEIYDRIYKIMLPGDFINMKLTGEVNTTISGLSEGVLWNFKENKPASKLMMYYGIDANLIPEYLPSVSYQGNVLPRVAEKLGISSSIQVTYRAGDQANNAQSLGVLEPNQVAATGGTSGVVYGILDEYKTDKHSRVNNFAHVNHSIEKKRLGVLLCINGAGILYSWMKNQIARDHLDYSDMEKQIGSVPIGSQGLIILPFGNGAERLLRNANPGASILNLQFNRHTKVHLYRAALEGIACSFVYGFELLRDLGLSPKNIKVGNDNLFRSEVFSNMVASLLGTSIEVIETTGAVGAAKASGIGVGVYADFKESSSFTNAEKTIHPTLKKEEYLETYLQWKVNVDRINK